MDEGGMGRWAEARARDGKAMAIGVVRRVGLATMGGQERTKEVETEIWESGVGWIGKSVLGNEFNLPLLRLQLSTYAVAWCCHHLICTCMQLLVVAIIRAWHYPASGYVHYLLYMT